MDILVRFKSECKYSILPLSRVVTYANRHKEYLRICGAHVIWHGWQQWGSFLDGLSEMESLMGNPEPKDLQDLVSVLEVVVMSMQHYEFDQLKSVIFKKAKKQKFYLNEI